MKIAQHNVFELLIRKTKNNILRRIESGPHWISTRGVLIRQAVLKIQQIFHVELWHPTPRQGGFYYGLLVG